MSGGQNGVAMREIRTAEEMVNDAFRGRNYLTYFEVIALVEEVMAAARASCDGDSHRLEPRNARTRRRRGAG
jgi:hypothetical protein